MIKKNEQVANAIINEYQNYAQSIIEIEKNYSPHNYLLHKINQEKQSGKSSSEVDLDSIMGEFHNIEKMKNEKIKIEEEKMKSEKEKLHSILNQFTQEMLIYVYNQTDNPVFKKEIKTKIFENNYQIYYLNNLACESGSIFQDLELMSKEELLRLSLLRETTDEITFNNSVLQKLNITVIRMISKVINGESLEEEKDDFCREHNLSNEVEFQFYKTTIRNQYLLDVATQTQQAFNDFLHIDNDDLIKVANNNLSSIKISIDGKSRKNKINKKENVDIENMTKEQLKEQLNVKTLKMNDSSEREKAFVGIMLSQVRI